MPRLSLLPLALLLAAGCSNRLQPGVAPDVVSSSRVEITPCADNRCEAPVLQDVPEMDTADAAIPADIVMADADPDAGDAPVVPVDVPGDVPVDGGGPPIVFNEIGGADPNYVELANRSSAPVDIGDYSLADTLAGSPDLSNAVRFPRGTLIGPNETLLVVTGRPRMPDAGVSTDCVGTATRCFHAPWTVSGSGEMIWLIAPDDTIAASQMFSPMRLSTNQTLGRIPHITGRNFYPNIATPGLPNRHPVQINEINGTSPDWVELYNASDGTYDLSEHSIGDSIDDETPRLSEGIRFPPGTVLGSHQFLFVLASQATATRDPQTVCTPSPNPGCFYAIFGISSGRGEAIWFLGPGDDVLERFFYPMGLAGGQTIGRFPDGSEVITNIADTPGVANRVP